MSRIWVANWSSINGKPTFATVATSGAYADLTGKPAIPGSPTISTPARALNTVYQLSTTRNAWVAYSVQIAVTASIGSGQSGDAILEVADDAAFTTNVRTVAIVSNAQVVTLAVALQSVQTSCATLGGYIPAAAYSRIRTVNVTGTPTFSIRAQQEALL